MPVLDGIEVFSNLRKGKATKILRQRGTNVRIIGVTAYVANESVQKCFDAGMDEVCKS